MAQLKVLVKDYRPKRTFLKLKDGEKYGFTGFYESAGEDCVRYTLTLEPRKSISIGVKNSDLEIAGSGPFFDDMAYLIGKAGRVGRIFHKGDVWFYRHELERPGPGSSGIAAAAGDELLPESSTKELTSGNSIDFIVLRRIYGDLEKTVLATMVVL